MGGLPFGGQREWSLAEKVAGVVDEGFDGIDIAWTPGLPAPEAIERAQAADLAFGVTCFPTSVAHFTELAETFGALDPRPVYLNIQPVPKVPTVLEGAALIREWSKTAEAAGFRPRFETHRDRMTTDLRFTLQLLEAVPEMRLTADLSHYLVGQEFAVPVSDENHELIRRVLERTEMFHGRVASREQVQIAVGWERHREWLDLFLGWWEEGFRLWRGRSGAGEVMVFVTELGPPNWYAITGADGNELSDRWEEALLLRQHVRQIWARLVTSEAAAG
jgi:hypothetical protein